MKQIHRERMRRLADLIERTDRFNYAHWINTDPSDGEEGANGMFLSEVTSMDLRNRCNTTACLAGWACVQGLEEDYMPKPFNESDWDGMSIPNYASHYLGLGLHEGTWLFQGGAMVTAGMYDDEDDALGHATAAEAAKLLRMVADGEVEFNYDRETGRHE